MSVRTAHAVRPTVRFGRTIRPESPVSGVMSVGPLSVLAGTLGLVAGALTGWLYALGSDWAAIPTLAATAFILAVLALVTGD